MSMETKTAENILKNNGVYTEYTFRGILKAMEEYAAQFKPAPLPTDIQTFIEDEATKKYPVLDGFTTKGVSHEVYTGQRWKREGFESGASAMYNLLSPQITELLDELHRLYKQHGSENTYNLIRKYTVL